MNSRPGCPGCGEPEGHQTWCYVARRIADLRAKQVPLRKPAASKTLPDSSPGLVPARELFPSDIPPIVTSEQPPTQSGGFKRTEAEIEAERGERREFVVVQWNGAEPLHATAEFLEVLVKPGDGYVLRNRRVLGEVLPLYPGEQPADALGRKPYGIMVRLK